MFSIIWEFIINILESSLFAIIANASFQKREYKNSILKQFVFLFIVKLNYPKLQNKNGHCCKSKLDKVAKVVYRLSGTV